MQMSTQPVLGKLWISLRLTNSEIRITGGRPEHQQQVIFRLIDEFGFNTVIHIHPPPHGRSGVHAFCTKKVRTVHIFGLQPRLFNHPRHAENHDSTQIHIQLDGRGLFPHSSIPHEETQLIRKQNQMPGAHAIAIQQT